MEQNDLYPSIEVKQQLEKYATLVPMTNAEFIVHFEEVHPGKKDCDCCPDERYGCGWYNAQYPSWTETKANATVNAVYDIIELYYPPEPTSSPTSAPTNAVSCELSDIIFLLPVHTVRILLNFNSSHDSFKPTMNPTSSPTKSPLPLVVPNPSPGQCSDGTGTCSTMADCYCSRPRKLLKGEAKQIGGRRNTQQYLRRLPKTWPTPPPSPPTTPLPVSPTNPVCNLSSYHMLMAFHCTYKFLM